MMRLYQHLFRNRFEQETEVDLYSNEPGFNVVALDHEFIHFGYDVDLPGKRKDWNTKRLQNFQLFVRRVSLTK